MGRDRLGAILSAVEEEWGIDILVYFGPFLHFFSFQEGFHSTRKSL